MVAADWRAMGLLALCWLGYFAVHSALASLSVKHWVARRYPVLMAGYRIAFNSLAVLLLLPIMYLVAAHRGPSLWAWQGAAAWLANALALIAAGAFLVSLKHYDGQEFLGLRQWASRGRQGGADGQERINDQEAFHLSPFHRYVRHPWYFFALVLIWTRDMDAARLVSGVMMSAYFIVGARLEEAKLLVYHGAVYRLYMERVAGLVPLPWKILGASDAADLVEAARRPGGRS
jgi:protein-S-isoprenylcysteine O-methyltransferase Ste14